MPTPTPTPILTNDVQHKLYQEADARFWAATGYKPGQKLDPKNPLDAHMVPAYVDIYRKVLAQWKAGTLTWTFDHPVVTKALDDASAASVSAAASMEAAARAQVASEVARARADAAAAAQHADEARAHVAAATAAHDAAQAATTAAAQVQPPTVSPAHVKYGAHHIQQFVMNAAGQGVPVGGGADAVAIMQATAAPGRAAVAQGEPDQAGYGAPPSPPDAGAGGSKASRFAIGAAIGASAFAAIGLAVYAVKGPHTISGIPRRRAA